MHEAKRKKSGPKQLTRVDFRRKSFENEPINGKIKAECSVISLTLSNDKLPLKSFVFAFIVF